MTLPFPPQPNQPLMPPTPPWTPFAVEPMDAEPPIAAIRKRRLARLMAKVEFTAQPEPWRQVVRDAYQQAVQALQAAQAQQAQAGQPVQPIADPNSADAGAEPAGGIA